MLPDPETTRAALLPSLAAALQSLERLTVYRGLRGDPVVRAYGRLLRRILQAAAPAAAGGQGRPLADRAVAAYCRLTARLAGAWAAAGLPGGAPVAPEEAPGGADLPGDAWQAYLLACILADENPFTLAAERGEVSPGLLNLAAHDLRALQRAYQVDGPALRAALAGLRGPGGAGGWPAGGGAGPEPPPLPAWNGLAARAGARAARPGEQARRASGQAAALAEMARRLASSPDWGACAAELAAWHRRHGAGVLARYRAFRWAGGRLEPVVVPDPITLDELIGYADQKAAVVRNTERFVGGLPASHVLLYGDRGTGKSATVKAVAHAFADRGLRLVELPRSRLHELAEALSALGRRGLRFILFVDDLSFEESDEAFKELKAVLEGSVEARPDNVVLYVTSNRRHLVRERFSDRLEGLPGTADGDVHPQDTVQEKLSLADRFGLTVIYPSPDQEAYLAIVRGLAARRGLPVPDQELRRRALQWALWRNGRSGRSARQFVDELVGELGLAAEGQPWTG